MSFFDKVGIGLVKRLRYPINTSAVVIMALYTFIWGLWLATPFWDVFTRADLYRYMSNAGPESLWGAIAIISGFVMLWGVAKPSAKSLERGAFTGAVHWFIISGFYFLGDWQNTGGLTALMVAAYCTFVWLNLRLNRGFIDYDA